MGKVSTFGTLLNALKNAKHGDVVYIDDTVEIDCTGGTLEVPGGVSLVSNGALLFSDTSPIIHITGTNPNVYRLSCVSIEGLHLNTPPPPPKSIMRVKWGTKEAWECEGYEAICEGCQQGVEWLEVLLPKEADDTTMICGFRCPRCGWEMKMISDKTLLMLKESDNKSTRNEAILHGTPQ